MKKNGIDEFKIQSHTKNEDTDILKEIITEKTEKIINYRIAQKSLLNLNIFK